jgi:hypothetical protein
VIHAGWNNSTPLFLGYAQQTEHMKATEFAVQRIAHIEARKFFERYEHLGNCGLGVWHWGGFLDHRLVAAVSFGTTCFAKNRGPLARVANEFGLGMYQISRGGTSPDAPFNTPSRVVSAALDAFRSERGDCLVVAYADRHFNEVGTIYQACNAIYTGLTQPKNQANYLIGGRVVSGWVVRKRFGTRDIELLRRFDSTVVKLPLRRKYRYVFPLSSGAQKKSILRALSSLSLPYPRRETEDIPPMDVSKLVKRRVTRKRLSQVFN